MIPVQETYTKNSGKPVACETKPSRKDLIYPEEVLFLVRKPVRILICIEKKKTKSRYCAKNINAQGRDLESTVRVLTLGKVFE